MDLIISGSEDSLTNAFSFDIPPTTSYEQKRSLVSYHCSGASTFSPEGVKVARIVFTVGDGGWLDPSSLRLTGRIANTYAVTPFTLADGPKASYPECVYTWVEHA